MNSYVDSFLQAVLGPDAATALRKAGERHQALSSVIGSRTIFGWLGFASRWGYEGEIPGTPGSWLSLGKTETGLAGEVRMGKNVHTFADADIPLVAATVCVALGADLAPDEDLRDDSITKLGQQVDLLITARAAAMAKAEHEGMVEWPDAEADECPVCGTTTDGEGNCSYCEEEHAKKPIEKGGFEAPGKQAEQKAPSGAAGGGFTPPTATTPSRKAKRGKFQAKLTQSQATTKCSVCEEPQFHGDEFTGCACLRDLAKHVDAEAAGDVYQLTFHEPWTKQDVALLMDIVSGGEVSDG